jgi:hypothetical protein|tara:strand:- start:83 stop:349 length:267 start_codon:yes stop_codon:yes gene_type:complete
MAYNSANLTRLSGASGISLWHYTTTEAFSTVRAEDYFEDAHPMLNMNDVILVISASGGTPVATLTYFNGVATTAVDVVDGNTISATDS